MSKDEKENRSKPKSGALDKFQPGGELGPVDDRNEYQQRLSSLPAEQRRWQMKACALPISASTSRSKRWISRRPSSKGWEMFPSFQ